MELSDLEKKILIHIYKYGPDTPWLMARRLLGEHGWAPKYDEGEIEMACTRLEEAGLLTRFKGSLKRSVTSSIKPWLKVKAKEMGHKPSGVYYDLTKEGRKLAEGLIRAHRLSERLLTDIIGIDWVRAHEIAHMLELFIT